MIVKGRVVCVRKKLKFDTDALFGLMICVVQLWAFRKAVDYFPFVLLDLDPIEVDARL